MSFPTIGNSQVDDGAATTAPDVLLPDNIAADDLLLILFVNDGAGSDPVATVTFPDFTQISTTQTTIFDDRVTLLKKKATGSEGTNIVGTLSASEAFVAITVRIPAAQWSGDIDDIQGGSSNSNGGAATTAPDPPTVTPSYGAEDTLWIVGGVWNDNTAINSYPYSSNNIIKQRASECSIAICTNELNATSLNPPAYSISLAQRCMGFTIAIRPSGIVAPVVTLFQDDVCMLMPTQYHGQVTTVIG